MAGITVKGIEELQASMGSAGGNLKKELGIVVWETGKKLKRNLAKVVVTELNTTQKPTSP